ncbi:MAG: hypothetical protein AAF587_06380 [Bacteroidota bacterium]
MNTSEGHQFSRQRNVYFDQAIASGMVIDRYLWATANLSPAWSWDSAFASYTDSLSPIMQGLVRRKTQVEQFQAFPSDYQQYGDFLSWKIEKELIGLGTASPNSLPDSGRFLLDYAPEEDFIRQIANIPMVCRWNWDESRRAGISFSSAPGIVMDEALFMEKNEAGSIKWEPLALYCNTNHGWYLIGLFDIFRKISASQLSSHTILPTDLKHLKKEKKQLGKSSKAVRSFFLFAQCV